jgi:hypothetical protein
LILDAKKLKGKEKTYIQNQAITFINQAQLKIYLIL